MERGSTLILKLAVILIGLPVLALCIFVVPEIADFAADLYPDVAVVQYLVYIVLYAAAIPFYVALYQAFRLLNYIDANQAFSDLSVRALKNIKFCAFTISGLLVLGGLPISYLLAERDDAPGIIIVGMVLAFAPVVIAVFAAVLQRLFQQAIDIKAENDLTV